MEFRVFLLRSLQNYYGKCFFFKFLTYNIIFFVEIVIELDEMVYVFLFIMVTFSVDLEFLGFLWMFEARSNSEEVRARSEDSIKMLQRTLGRMAAGGIRDHVGGVSCYR